MRMTHRIQRLFGRSEGESAEQFMRRVDCSPIGSNIARYIGPAVPSIVELYDRIAVLERRIADVERQHGSH